MQKTTQSFIRVKPTLNEGKTWKINGNKIFDEKINKEYEFSKIIIYLINYFLIQIKFLVLPAPMKRFSKKFFKPIYKIFAR